MHFLMTVDVECQSMASNKEDLETVRQIEAGALPSLLELLGKYDVTGTFYFTGKFAEVSPGSLELVKEAGHEIGCHGHDHSPHRAFDLLSLVEQKEELVKAKNAIEPVAGRLRSFRAPALRVNEYTARALEAAGFSSDSSVASQRFDGPFTFGSKRKLKWLFAPRKPYRLAYDSPFKTGGSSVLEIPVSALGLPFIGTTLRINPTIIRKIIGKMLYVESRTTGKPVVFLFHPNECLNYKNVTVTRRAKGTFEYIFADLIRQRMKIRNMGPVALRLLEDVLRDARDYGFEFSCMSEYEKQWRLKSQN
ncbi:MAG TPA: polysaccharide deacetylase [Euryarchaeota archaeon]|nr:polysaccharide deacetylase [Euryarchaeota archaeon]